MRKEDLKMTNAMNHRRIEGTICNGVGTFMRVVDTHTDIKRGWFINTTESRGGTDE